MYYSTTKGFTLIEILVVVVIVSIVSVMGVQMISSGSVERNLQQHGRILQASIEYSCDQAILQNRSYGLRFYQTGYQFSQYTNQQWIEVTSEIISNNQFADGSLLSLEIDGYSVVLPEEVDEVPQLMCDSSGQLTPFIVRISDATKQHHYQLKSIDFWRMQGQWLDETKN